MILKSVPPPSVDPDAAFQMQVTNLDYSDYLGRMFGGKIIKGSVKVGDRLTLVNVGKQKSFNVTKLWVYKGIDLEERESVESGEIAMMSGLDDVLIGDTICDANQVEALPQVEVEPPTLSMNFYANTSPLSGKDGGKFLTIHKIRERIEKEEKTSVCLKIDPNTPGDTVKVYARGELQLAILIETMRREGFEMAISRPQVLLLKNENGQTTEPFEILSLDLPEDGLGSVMEEAPILKSFQTIHGDLSLLHQEKLLQNLARQM